MKPKFKKDNSLFSCYSFIKKDKKEYPVISRILKELTPERIEKEIEIKKLTKLFSFVKLKLVAENVSRF